MINFVYTLCSSTPGQIQYGGFKRALAKKSGDMIRERVRILYLLILCFEGTRKFKLERKLHLPCSILKFVFSKTMPLPLAIFAHIFVAVF